MAQCPTPMLRVPHRGCSFVSDGCDFCGRGRPVVDHRHAVEPDIAVFGELTQPASLQLASVATMLLVEQVNGGRQILVMARGLWIGRPRQRAILEPAADGVDSGARTWSLLQIYDRVSMMRSDVFADCANRVIAISVVVVGDHIAVI